MNEEKKICNYKERAEATFQDIGLRVFLIGVILSLPALLLSGADLMGFDFSNNYYSLVSFKSIVIGIYGVLINIGLFKAIILHSRGIEEFDGLGSVFKGMSKEIFNIIAISIIINLITTFVIFLLIFPLSFVGVAALSKPTSLIGITTIFLVLLIPGIILMNSYLEILANSSSLLLIFDNEPIFKTISNARKTIKENKAFQGYLRIKITFMFIFLLIIVGGIGIPFLLSSPMLLLITLPAIFVFIAIYSTKYTISLSVFLGDVVLSEYLNKKYPEIDQGEIY